MPTIVIVDDRVTNRRILSRLAGDLDDNILVESFADPLDALAWLREQPADLIITDFKMPQMDGAAFIHELRQLGNCRDVPVIVVTAYEDKSYRYSAFDAGATDFLTSPVDHKEFRARTRNLLKMRAQQLLLAERAVTLQKNLEKSNRLHRVALRESEENFRLVVNSIPAMVSVVDSSQTYDFINNFMAWSLGIDPAMAHDQSPVDLLGADTGLRQQNIDDEVFKNGLTPAAFEEKLVDQTGIERHLLTVKTPLKDTAGKVTNVVTTSVDITERKTAEMALEAQRNLLRQVLDLDPGYVLTVDTGGRVRLANQSIADAFGVTPQQLVGRSLSSITPVADEGRTLLSDINTAFSSDTSQSDVERTLTTADGRQHWVKLSIVPFDDPDTKERRALLVGMDVSTLKEAESAMHDAKLAAELSNRSKSNFLATMSHELRTPLNAIIGFSQMISGQVLGAIEPPVYTEYATDIENSGKHLHGIISDILDVALIESGKFSLNEGTIDVPTLFDSLGRLLRERTDQNDIEFSWMVTPDTPSLHADEQRVKQVLMNITSNAVKFTPPGGKISIEAKCSAAGAVHVLVRDTGIGMAEDEIQIALDQFSQVQSGLSRPYEGAGLGLPLSAALLDMHNAKLDIQSGKGTGTLVTIMFPKERSMPQRASRSV
ncbi:MAG: PAS domain-containing protein [Chromatiales bacterium]|jgi:PAS domain S-box-containing protein|nr:PAS domain-containing protein [Chromatiales bacterium]